MFNVGSIVGELVLKDEFSGELKSAEQTSAKASKNLQVQLMAVSAAAVALGAAMIATAKATANYRDETTKAARRAGIAVDEFSQLRHAAELSGIQFNELAISMSKLASPEAQKRLDRIGVSMKNLDGTAKSNSEIFSEVADKVAKAGTASEKSRIAVAAFGEEGSKLVSMLDNGAEGLEKLKQEAIDLGIAFDEEAGKQAELFNDNLDRLGKAVQGLRDSFGQAVIEFVNSTGIVEGLRDAIASVTKWFNGLDQSTKDIIVALGAVVVAVGLLIAGFMAIQAIGPAVGAAITAAFGPIGLVIAAVAAEVVILVGAVVLLVKNWDRMGRAVEPIERVFQKLKDVFTDIWHSVQEAIPVVKDLFSGDSGKGFLDYVLDGLFAIIKVVSTVIVAVEKLISSVPTIFKMLGSYMELLWTQMRLEMKIFKNEAEQSVLDQLVTVKEKLGNELQEYVKTVGRSLGQDVRQIWNTQLADRAPENAGEQNGQDYANGAQNSMENQVPEKVKNIWEKLESDGPLAVAIEHAGAAMGGELGDALQKGSKKMADGIKQIAQGYMDTLNAVAEATVAKIQRVQGVIDTIGQLVQQQMQKRHEAEMAALDDRYAKEIALVQNTALEKKLIEDEALAAKKQRLEEELAAELEKERILFEQKKQFLLDNSVDEQQANLAKQQMEEDWSKYVEMRRGQLNEQLLNEDQKASNNKQQIEADTQTQISVIQEQRNKERESLNAKQEEEEKRHTKEMAAIQYAYDLYAYEAQRQVAIASAGMKFAETIMSAVQAGATLAAIAPPVSIPLGIALTATLIGMGTIAYGTAISTIAAQKPLPPPALFAESGGLIQGPSHAQGGVMVNAQGNEAILNTGLTDRITAMVERDEQGKSRSGIIIGQGAIVIYNYGTMDDGAVDKMAVAVAEKIEQRRY